VLSIEVISRVFLRGFEISTPLGCFSTKRVPDLPTEQILILDPSGNQAARLGLESSTCRGLGSFFSGVYNIIIIGGGFYQFGRDDKSRRAWICKGEDKLFRISERNSRKFLISDGTEGIADFSKARYASDYAVRVLNDADWKLVICIVIALDECERVERSFRCSARYSAALHSVRNASDCSEVISNGLRQRMLAQLSLSSRRTM
jgi:hypothetical protein